MGREPEGQSQPLQNRAHAEQAAEGARSWLRGRCGARSVLLAESQRRGWLLGAVGA